MIFLIFILLQLPLLAADFDCVVIGTSPFSLLEALYQSHSGKKVLILEEDTICGGAWKSIATCGVAHADLGCHLIGQDVKLKEFLEEYVGCQIVSLDNPLEPFRKENNKQGWYFSKGCFELIDQLLKLVALTDITLYTNCRAEQVSFKKAEKMAIVHTERADFTTHKLILTPMSRLALEQRDAPSSKSKFYHLYLLVQDPSPPCFTYQSNIMSGVMRVMNLTYFVDLIGTGRQLIVIQTPNEQNLAKGQLFVDELIKRNLLDPGAYILKEETYIYEAGTFQQNRVNQLGIADLVDVLHTGHIQGLANYIEKWKQVLKPVHNT